MIKQILFIAFLLTITYSKDNSLNQDQFSKCLGKCSKHSPDCIKSDNCKNSAKLINEILYQENPENENCKNFQKVWQTMEQETKFPQADYLKCLEYASTLPDLKKILEDTFKQIMQCNCLCAENLPEAEQSKTQCKYYEKPKKTDQDQKEVKGDL